MSQQPTTTRLSTVSGRLVRLAVVALVMPAACQKNGSTIISAFKDTGVRRDLERADDLVAEQKLDLAVGIYQDILRRDPSNAAVNARMGKLRFMSGDYEQAAQYFRTALKTEPSSFAYALALAQCQGRLAMTSLDREKKMEAAARAYRYAHTLEPNNFTAIIQLALCYREQGDFDKATQTLQEAAKLSPHAAVIHTQLGEIYHAQNRIEEALAEFNRALRMDPQNVEAHNGCALVNVALSQAGGAKAVIARERAVAHFRRSLQLCNTQPQVRSMLEQLEPYLWKAVTTVEEAPE